MPEKQARNSFKNTTNTRASFPTTRTPGNCKQGGTQGDRQADKQAKGPGPWGLQTNAVINSQKIKNKK